MKMKEYHIETITTGCFSGTLNPLKLKQLLNDQASNGWHLG
jgi:hypothetical protein